MEPASELSAEVPEAAHAIPLLTAASPKLPTPVSGAVSLWPHQQAMLARCVAIEAAGCRATNVVKNTARYFVKEDVIEVPPVRLGILNDPPGCGKTYVLLSLIAHDLALKSDAGDELFEAQKLNIIVVPQNIFAQWKAAIKTFLPKGSPVRVKYINQYGDLFADFKKTNILLVNDGYADTLAQTVLTNKIHVHRLIIDEIDSVQERIHTPFPVEHVWLVSASFVHKDASSVGPYLFSSSDIPNMICKCDPAFVAESLKFEEPVMEVLRCEDADIELFAHIVPMATRIALYAGDKRPLLQWLGKSFPPEKHTLSELLTMYIKDQKARLLEARGLAAEDSDEDTDSDSEHETTADQTSEAFFAMKEAQIAECEAKVAAYVPVDPLKTKKGVFKNDICERIRANPDQKWLIFNDNTSALFDAQTALEGLGVKAVMLDGGNVAAVDRAITNYKTKDVQVLLLNSMLEGCGMNLENTTHLLFMHATRPRLVEQVVGRAQRFGRKGALNIIGLFNNHENESMAIDDDEVYAKRYFVAY